MSDEQLRFLPLGDRALLVELGRDPGLEGRRHVLGLLEKLDRAPPPGVEDLVPGVTSLMVVYDPLRVELGALESLIQSALSASSTTRLEPRTTLEIPVVYGGRHGPDLQVVADLHGLSPGEVIRLHVAREYEVVMLGFMPGFPYLGGLPLELETPRLKTPRVSVPRGSVAIAGRQSGIYPASSPGGWRILGWTPLSLFDAARTPPTLLRPGDTVRFVSVTEQEAASWRP